MIVAWVLSSGASQATAAPASRGPEPEVARQQAWLFFEKALEIVTVPTIILMVLSSLLILLLGNVLAARICFGGQDVWIRTIKTYVYSFITGFVICLLIAIAPVFGIIGVFLMLLLVVAMLVAVFAIPMAVFEAGFLRTLCYLILSSIIWIPGNALSTWLSKDILLGQDRMIQFNRLTQDLSKGRIQKETNYATKRRSDARPSPAATPLTPQAEYNALMESKAELDERLAKLKQQFEALDKSNSSAVAKYNEAYNRYLAEYRQYVARRDAYSARMTSASAASPQ